MNRVQRFLGVLLVIGYVCSGAVAHAATYYVATNGSNGYSCSQAQSAGTPKLTLSSSLRCLAAGDTLLVRGGTYDEGISWVPSGTSWNNKVRVANYPGETVWLTPLSAATSAGGKSIVIWLDGNFTYVEFDGINLDGRNLPGGLNLWVSTNNGNDPHHIRFQNAEVIAGLISGSAAIQLGSHNRAGQTGANELINVTIHGGGVPGLCGWQCNSYGVYVEGPNNLIDGCDIYDTSGAGIHIYNASGDSPDNNTVRNNRIHDITRTGSLDQVWGIIVTGNNNHIYNNVIYRINVGNPIQGNAGLVVYAASNTEVYNNTVYGNSGWGIVTSLLAYGSVVRNNISYGNRQGNYFDYGIGTFQTNNLFSDPRFVNAGGGDFRLTAGSPAIDAGAYLDRYPYDQLGVSRPQGNGYDIGAYEFTGGSAAPAPAPPAPAPPSAPAPPPVGLSPSPDGTRVPGASSVVDSALNVWTIGPGNELLKNGSQAASGYGFAILAYQGNIYVQGDDYNWWRWTGSTFAFYGGNAPI
jgi:parallel beta-helix repeat protein